MDADLAPVVVDNKDNEDSEDSEDNEDSEERARRDEDEDKCKWGSGLLKSCLCFLTSKKHKQDCKQCGTTTWG